MTPLPAATLVVARDAPGLEVLVVERDAGMRFAPGAHVFPGGAVDAEDSAAPLWSRCTGRTDPETSAQLGMDAGGLAFWVAAVRECFEEAGLLLARHRSSGEPVTASGSLPGRLARHRADLCEARRSLVDVLVEEDLELDLSRVHYLSRWVTPAHRPLRYDTRFFVAEAPAAQVPSFRPPESVGMVWDRPERLIARAEEGELRLLTPTLHTVRWASAYSTVSDLVESLQEGGLPPVGPPEPPGSRLMPALTLTER